MFLWSYRNTKGTREKQEIGWEHEHIYKHVNAQSSARVLDSLLQCFCVSIVITFSRMLSRVVFSKTPFPQSSCIYELHTNGHTPIRQSFKLENNFSTVGKSFLNLMKLWFVCLVAKYCKCGNVVTLFPA